MVRFKRKLSKFRNDEDSIEQIRGQETCKIRKSKELTKPRYNSSYRDKCPDFIKNFK